MRSVRVICPSDVQPLHFVLQSCPLQAEALSSSVPTGHSPKCGLQCIDNYLPLGFFECRTCRCRGRALCSLELCALELCARDLEFITWGQNHTSLDEVFEFA